MLVVDLAARRCRCAGGGAGARLYRTESGLNGPPGETAAAARQRVGLPSAGLACVMWWAHVRWADSAWHEAGMCTWRGSSCRMQRRSLQSRPERLRLASRPPPQRKRLPANTNSSAWLCSGTGDYTNRIIYTRERKTAAVRLACEASGPRHASNSNWRPRAARAWPTRPVSNGAAAPPSRTGSSTCALMGVKGPVKYYSTTEKII